MGADEEPSPPQANPVVQSPNLMSVCRLSGCRMIGVLDSSTADTDPLMEVWQMIRGVPPWILEAVKRAVARFEDDLWKPEALGLSDFNRQVYAWGYLAARCAKSEGLEWELRFPHEGTITSLQQPDQGQGGVFNLCVVEFGFDMFDQGGMLVWSCPRAEGDDDTVAVSWLPYHYDRSRDDLVRKSEAERIISLCVHDEELTYQSARKRMLAVEAALHVEMRSTDEWGDAVIAATRMAGEAAGNWESAATEIASRHLKDSLANLQLRLRSPV